MTGEAIKVNDIVRSLGSETLYRVVEIAPVCGIPAADLIRVRRRDMSDAICRRRALKNLPLSCLERREG